MNIERLKKIHRYSGIILATFFLFHIVNHLFAWGGPDTHIRVMNLFRHVYRFPPVEVILLLSALIQVTVGLMLVWQKGFRKNLYDLLQVISGLYLSFFLLFHIRAVLLGRYSWNVETDFYFAAWGVKNHPADLFFIPYYSLSVLCVFIHLACVHRQKMLALAVTNAGVVTSPLQVTRQAIVIIATGIVVTALILAAFIIA
jgi:succinate dehydrogenase/fumarate reductase cytochrome b subunit